MCPSSELVARRENPKHKDSQKMVRVVLNDKIAAIPPHPRLPREAISQKTLHRGQSKNTHFPQSKKKRGGAQRETRIRCERPASDGKKAVGAVVPQTMLPES